MVKNFVFSLSGVGYLRDVVRKNDGIYARVNLFHQFNAGSRSFDDVWIDCLVKEEGLLKLLMEFENNLKKHKSVILHFDAEYSSFDYCHIGMTEDDPSCIVHFKGKLRSVDEYFVNGVSYQDNLPHAMRAPV